MTMSPQPLDRYFLPIAAFLLALLAAAQIGSAVVESPINDEPMHVTAGYVYLTTGEYKMDLSHPPLARVLAALPLLSLRLKPIPAAMAWPEFRNMIWANRVSAETIMLRARSVIIALTFCFGLWLAWWTRLRFGSAVALLALAFFAFDPNLIAHGHYVTTDLVASFGIFLACTLWADFLQKPNWKSLALAAIALGIALVSKYSAIYLLFVLPLLYATAWWLYGTRPFFSCRAAIATFLAMTAGSLVVIGLAYLPDARSPQPARQAEPSTHKNLGVKILTAIDSHTGLFSIAYFRGLNELAQHDADGHLSYLLGRIGVRGWWEYFPVVFLVKTPTGILLAGAIALLSLVTTWRRRPPPRILLLLSLTAPPLIYFALALHSSIDIGVRHLLPIYPFLYVLLAFVLIEYAPLLLKKSWRWTIAALVLLVAAESLSTYPHYLAFFNWTSGGPAHGSRYLLDSNIDWGQDAKTLAAFVDQHHIAPLCTALFGPTLSSYYVVSRDLNQTGFPEGIENMPCAIAVSVNFLRGLYIPAVVYAPLNQHRPIAEIGHSIYIYDLRRNTF
jgi:hypothetical protein